MNPFRALTFLIAVSISNYALANDASGKVNVGDNFPALVIKNIHDVEVKIPDSNSKFVHFQFRRFAGCPICSLHMQEFIKRSDEIKAAGIHEVVVFHSSKESLLPYQGGFPFDIIGDPKKELYKKFGVESSIFALLNPKVWPAMIKSMMAENKPKGDPEGGRLGLPADFLISADGKVVASFYGSHAFDQWDVDELLAYVQK